jgi:hypothetical protein
LTFSSSGEKFSPPPPLLGDIPHHDMRKEPLMFTRTAHPVRAFVIPLVLLGLLHASGQTPNVVISQVYGGGGNSGATLKNDFVELLNRTSSPVDITGWSVQYCSAAGSTWQATILSGTIAPYHYYLIQEAAGTGGTVDLPTPDAVGTIMMSGTAGKVALVNTASLLTGTCPYLGIADFIGYGTANCSETSPAPALTNITAALRKGAGMTDTYNNSADFETGAPIPRNSLSNPAVGVEADERERATPQTLSLFQNFPNPFNPSTTIDYALPRASFVSIRIYDALGQEVATLVGEEKPAGKHSAIFDASGLPSGAYLCRLQAAGMSATTRLLLLR